MRSRPATGANPLASSDVAASEGAEGYEIKYAQDQAAFPDPKWPTRTLEELLEITFRKPTSTTIGILDCCV